MKKVFSSIRQINKLKKDENYRLFNSVAHYEITCLSKVFKQWKSIAEETRKIKLKENKKVEEGRKRADGVWMRAGWKRLIENVQKNREDKRRWVVAMRFNDKMIKQRAFDMIWKVVEMAREERIGEEEKEERAKQFCDRLHLKRGFLAFMMNSQEIRDQREMEEQAYRMRQQEITKHVLKHWIKVGNYWIDKKYQSNRVPISTSHITFVPSQQTMSPLKGSENFETSDSKRPDYNYEYSFKKSPNNPSPSDSSSSHNQSIGSSTLEKMERIKALLSSVKAGTPSPTPSI
jgi:hypothetical protein